MPEPTLDNLVRHARRLVVRHPGHPDLHGVAFPSGRVLADAPHGGFTAAVSIDALCEGMTGHTVHWADEPDPETWQQCPASGFDGYGLQCQKEAGHNLCSFEQEEGTPDARP